MGRKRHELECLKRWFILKDYMKQNNLTTAFFGDGDAVVFRSILAAYKERADCDAVINIETQPNDIHWVGAGESSIWTYQAIVDLCE